MSREEEIRNIRIQKIERLEEFGESAYIPEIEQKSTIHTILEDFDSLQEQQKTLSVMGRIIVKRGAGNIAFAKVFDGTGRIQVVLKKDLLGKEKMKAFEKLYDIGDFALFSGTLFVTDRGEKSLLVEDFQMLTKSLRPLPEKWAGLKDQDEIYRKRYLQLLTNQEAFERFIIRAKIIREIRHFFDNLGFLEVETPILQNSAGGAMAKVFETHHNDLDIDMVMRISLELEHKMIMAAGYPRIYEIGKAFRNEGSDPTHIQEFTMIEWYAAYATLEQNMAWTEELLKKLARDVIGKMQFQVKDSEGGTHEVDFDQEWPRLRFPDLLKEHAEIDIQNTSREELENKAFQCGLSHEDIKNTGDANLLDYIYKKSVRNNIIHPTFITDYPGDLKPLAQQNEDGTARVAQLIIAGAEITNQYAELVNPLRQRELLEAQAKAKQEGDEEAMDVDERFLTAMEHGMPPMTGFGMGIDRLVTLLTEQGNLRDVIFFPIMRPKE